MESSSRSSKTAWRLKIKFYFQKRSKLNFDSYFDLCRSAEITLVSSISVPTVVIDTSIERSSRVRQHENPEYSFSFHKNCILTCAQVLKPLASSISVMHVVIDTWMERLSQVLWQRNPKIKFDFILKKMLTWVLLLSFYVNNWIIILPDDVCDASSSLWGSTSSTILK